MATATLPALNAVNSFDVQEEVTMASRVNFYATNFLTAVLTGDGSAQTTETIRQFHEAIPAGALNQVPMHVSDFNVADTQVTTQEDGTRLWSVTLGATQTTQTVSARGYFKVNVLEKDGALTIASMPVPVSLDRAPITMDNGYSTTATGNDPLYQVGVNFAAAYLVSGNEGSFGRYVTSGFTERPLQNSPYRSVDSVKVNVKLPTASSPETAEAGTRAPVIIRAHAVITPSTYVIVDLPVVAVKQDNGQWLIDEMTDPETGGVREVPVG